MAISHTMSNSSHWISQPYQSDFFSQTETPPATIPTAASAAASRNNNLIPDQGRVSKPVRRRARASRRTPTTLLNTDTANFRAMVQQFTGAPAAPFAARPQLVDGGGVLNFMERIATTNANAAAAAVPGSGFHVQYIPSQLQQQQNHMFMVDNMHGGGGGDGGGLSTQAAAPGSENGGYGRSYML